MSKRTHGEGSISKKQNGSWLAQVSVDGKRISRVFKTSKEAQEWIATTTRQVKQGLSYTSTKTTVNELLTLWLEMKRSNSRPATSEQYSRYARLHISPFMGSMKLQDVTPARVQGLYNHLQNAGKGKRTIEIVHTILHGFLGYANKMGLVAQNWAAMVEVPRPEKREMSVWNESQVSEFLMFVENDPFYRLAFATGMRRGELIGLQWKDIVWETGMLHVKRQVYEPEGGGYIFQPPKTENGKRSIRLGTGLLDALRNHYQNTIPLMKAIAGDQWKENDLIFPSGVGTPRNGYSVSKTFHDKATASGLPVIRFHDIRHTAASIMLLHSEPPVRVAAILGQSVAVLLNTYAHYIQDDQERASQIMDEVTTVVQIDLNLCNRIATKTGEFAVQNK